MCATIAGGGGRYLVLMPCTAWATRQKQAILARLQRAETDLARLSVKRATIYQTQLAVQTTTFQPSGNRASV